jgi:hypothetical protein
MMKAMSTPTRRYPILRGTGTLAPRAPQLSYRERLLLCSTGIPTENRECYHSLRLLLCSKRESTATPEPIPFGNAVRNTQTFSGNG